ncbi:MAG: hypothetical protein ACRECD_16040 [Burkholderiaceae bacterium]
MKTDIVVEITAGPLPSQEVCEEVRREKHMLPHEQNATDVQIRVAKALAKDTPQFERFLKVQQAGFIAGGRVNAAAGFRQAPHKKR